MKKNKNKIIDTLDHCLSLLIVFLLLSSISVWGGKFLGKDILHSDNVTLSQSAINNTPDNNVLAALNLNPAAITIIQRDSATWQIVSKKDKKDLGHIVHTAPYARDIIGFAGATPLYIYVSPEQQILQIAPGNNEETPSFYKKAYNGIIPHWIGQDLDNGKDLEVDAVSGATYTSNALIHNVKNTLDICTAHHTTVHKAPGIGWLRTSAVCLVLVLGLLAANFNHRNRYIRPIMLTLNVLVLGFWCGQFLSLSLLRGWVTNGLDPLLSLPTVAILAVIILSSFFSHKRHYCTWVCPLGSLQSLSAMLPLPKIKVNEKVAKFLNRLRFYTFCILMVVLWLGLGGTVLDYEPFTAFMLDSALPAVSILAAVIVISSCFIPNIWCRALCPMGSLIDLSEK